jgi:hypothetical protein
MRAKVTLTVDPEVLERIKIRAIREKRSVSSITEEMWKRYLEEREGEPAT